MDFFQTLILALVQGITEFLPISSSAHLILAPVLFGWEDQGLAFDVAVHAGTLLAVILYFRVQLAHMAVAGAGSLAGRWTPDAKLAWAVVLATLLEMVRAQQQGLDARFGDGEAPDYVESLPLAGVPWVVSTLPDRASNHALLNALSEHHYSGQIAIVARDEADAASLRSLGQVEIIMPFNQAADFAALDLAARIAVSELNTNRATRLTDGREKPTLFEPDHRESMRKENLFRFTAA